MIEINQQRDQNLNVSTEVCLLEIGGEWLDIRLLVLTIQIARHDPSLDSKSRNESQSINIYSSLLININIPF